MITAGATPGPGGPEEPCKHSGGKMRAAIAAGVSLLASAVIPLTPAALASEAAETTSAAVNYDMAGYGVPPLDGGDLNVTVRNATAAWIQPRAIPRGYHDAYSLAFVGFNNQFAAGTGSDQPQIGTAADAIGGKTAYFDWYSASPAGSCGYESFCQPMRLRNSVRPGDHISASITWRGTRATLVITDVRYRKGHKPSRWTRKIRVALPSTSPAGMTVGVSPWINAESEGQPLADFTPVRFTHVDVNGSVIGSYLPDNCTQYNDFGEAATLASSSALDKTGDGFTVTWRRAGP
jgi:hypothetical protein